MTSLPTTGETFTRLIEHLRRAQEEAAKLAHLHNDTDRASALMAKGWLTVSEGLKEMQKNVIKLATRGRLN